LIAFQVAKLRVAVEEGREERVLILNYKRDGTPFWNRIHIAPMRDNQGRINFYISEQCEVSEINKA
jgi:PAS domain-containing protein